MNKQPSNYKHPSICKLEKKFPGNNSITIMKWVDKGRKYKQTEKRTVAKQYPPKNCESSTSRESLIDTTIHLHKRKKTSVVLIRMKTKGVIVMNEVLIVRKQSSEAFFVVYCVLSRWYVSDQLLLWVKDTHIYL